MHPAISSSAGPAPVARLLHALPRGRTLPQRQFATRHRWIVRLLWFHVAALPLLALGYGYGVAHSLAEGAIVAAFAMAASLPRVGRRVQGVLAAAGLLTCSAVLVHIANGLIEAHFHFFVVVTVLSLYEDWTVFGLSIGYVLVHHGLASVLGEDVFSHAGNSWAWGAVHAGFITALSLANVVNWRATEQMRVQERTARAELERSNSDLERFAYAASHDLSEPLRMVKGHLELLERRNPELDVQSRELLGHAVGSAQRMRVLIDDLLGFSRVERHAPPLEPVDVRETVDATLRDLAAAVAEADAVVEVAGPLPVVAADPVQLGQVFQNLIANAVKFHDGAPPRVRVDADRVGAEWRFTVADNGIGIAPDHAEDIFRMFERLHSRDAFQGNGIGLALCRRIVDRHGGRIWVEPNPAGGSRFVFTIPDCQ